MGNSVVQYNTGNYWTLLHGIASTKEKKISNRKNWKSVFLCWKNGKFGRLILSIKIDKAKPSKLRSFQIMLRLVKSIAWTVYHGFYTFNEGENQ